MRILVTGTAGFIGFHLTQKLIELGHDVVGLDNFNDYYSPSLKEERHRILKTLPRFTEVRGDIADTALLKKLFDEHRPDTVCNLAAQAGVRYSLVNPGVYIHSNLDGFYAIIDAALAHKVQRLVYASSSSVYGGNTKLPFSEEDRVDQPISLYAATKRANELIAHSYTHLHGIETVGLRFFTVYGPWGRPDMAIWQFAQRMMKGEPIKVYNHGAMKRDFTYIDDIVAGIVAALTTRELERYEIMNLGNNNPVELMHVIKLLEEGLGCKATMHMLPIQQGDVPVTYADIDRAKAKLGFEPKTTIEEGLTRFLAWLRAHEKIFMTTTFAGSGS